MIKVDIKCEESFIACGESDLTEIMIEHENVSINLAMFAINLCITL